MGTYLRLDMDETQRVMQRHKSDGDDPNICRYSMETCAVHTCKSDTYRESTSLQNKNFKCERAWCVYLHICITYELPQVYLCVFVGLFCLVCSPAVNTSSSIIFLLIRSLPSHLLDDPVPSLACPLIQTSSQLISGVVNIRCAVPGVGTAASCKLIITLLFSVLPLIYSPAAAMVLSACPLCLESTPGPPPPPPPFNSPSAEKLWEVEGGLGEKIVVIGEGWKEHMEVWRDEWRCWQSRSSLPWCWFGRTGVILL